MAHIHTYPQNPLRKIKVAIYNHQAGSVQYTPRRCIVSDLVFCNPREERDVIRDTKSWDQYFFTETKDR